MLRYLLAAWQRRQLTTARAQHHRAKSLQIVLWVLWTLVVALVAYFSWHADATAHQPFNPLGLTIHCLLAGLVGLIVITKIEMWLQPWRFFDETAA